MACLFVCGKKPIIFWNETGITKAATLIRTVGFRGLQLTAGRAVH